VRQSVVAVAIQGEERVVSVARGPREPIQPGPGFAVYEARIDAGGRSIEEFVTVICNGEPTLYAVTDEQFRAGRASGWSPGRFGWSDGLESLADMSNREDG
jgi:hypothetical protein